MSRAYGYIWGSAFVIALWWVLAIAINSPALPSPIDTVPVLVDNFSALVPEFGISLFRIVLAMLIGTILGAPLGIFMGRSAWADRLLTPVMYILYPLPKIVLLPILFVLIGIGGESKVALIAIAVFFQMAVTMRDAAKAVPRESVEAMLSFGAGRRQVLASVIVPNTLPALFTALRVTTASAIAILFIAESMAGSSGLGYFIMHSWSILEYTQMFAGIVAMALLGILLYELFDFCERRLTAWREAENDKE